MTKLTVLFGPHGSGKTSIAQSLARKRKSYTTSFNNAEDPLLMNHVLHHRPEVVIVDECPLEALDQLVKLCNGKTIRIQHAVTGLHEIETPELIVIIQNSVSAQQVFTKAAGRNIELIECTRKEVANG